MSNGWQKNRAGMMELVKISRSSSGCKKGA
jgi:hypothetical protein